MDFQQSHPLVCLGHASPAGDSPTRLSLLDGQIYDRSPQEGWTLVLAKEYTCLGTTMNNMAFRCEPT